MSRGEFGSAIPAEIESFLSHLATERHVSASTQNQAFTALLFLYRNVLEMDLENVSALRAKGPERLPVVLSIEEVRLILGELDGIDLLLAELLYGTGWGFLRLRLAFTNPLFSQYARQELNL